MPSGRSRRNFSQALSACGGARVDALRDLARDYAGQPVTVLHAGGEILGCTLAQAAVMLLDRREARSVLARFADAASLQRWAQDWLGVHHPLAYLAPRTMFAPGSRFFYHGIGGVALASLPSAMQAEAASELRAADGLWVRDRQTREVLAARGVRAHLAPDLAVLAPTLLAAEIAAASQQGEPGEARQRFAAGYIAVQFAAALGDDATLRHNSIICNKSPAWGWCCWPPVKRSGMTISQSIVACLCATQR